MMATIAWNPLEFGLLDALPKSNTFNIEYYRVNILTELLPFHPQANGGLIIHAGSARPHTARECQAFCEENPLRLAVPTPYSPDLAPPDFFLFGHVKYCLHGILCPSREELLAAIHEIVEVIPRPTLEDLFWH
jgi:transposase